MLPDSGWKGARQGHLSTFPLFPPSPFSNFPGKRILCAATDHVGLGGKRESLSSMGVVRAYSSLLAPLTLLLLTGAGEWEVATRCSLLVSSGSPCAAAVVSALQEPGGTRCVRRSGHQCGGRTVSVVSCLALRGGRGGGGAGGLWRDMPAPRLGSRRARKKLAASPRAPNATGVFGLPVQRVPGFEDDVSEQSDGDADQTNPKVLARRRRNCERRQRLVQRKREEEAEQRQQALQKAILDLHRGSVVLAHFKTKSGQSKHPAILNVTSVNLTDAQVFVKTASGRAQVLPVSWILAVQNSSAVTGSLASSDAVSTHSNEAGSAKAGSEKEAGDKKRNWIDEAKLKEIVHRRRRKARLRRKERHKRKRFELRMAEEQQAAIRGEELAVRSEERRLAEREAQERRAELHKQYLFNTTDTLLGEAFEKNTEIADNLYRRGLLRDVSGRELDATGIQATRAH